MPLSHPELLPLLPALTDVVQRAYPDEGCGLIVESGGGLRVLPLPNRQAELHHFDPERFPSPRRAFHLGAADLAAVNSKIRAVFHSHPDRGAYLSDADRAAALPGCDQIVVSVGPSTVRELRVRELRVYGWDAGSAQLVERYAA